MKKGAGITALLLAAVMLLAVPAQAAVPSAKPKVQQTVSLEPQILPGLGSLEDLEDAFPASERAFTGTAPVEYSKEYYRSQLDVFSQAVYDGILNGALGQGPTLKTVTISLDVVPEADRTIAATVIVTEENGVRDYNCPAASSSVDEEAVTAAVIALIFDHPELPWLVNIDDGIQYSGEIEAPVLSAEQEAQLKESGRVTLSRIPLKPEIRPKLALHRLAR